MLTNKVLVRATMTCLAIATAICLLYKGHLPTGEAILATGLLLVLLVGLWWHRLESHRAFGTGLLCVGAAALFADSWIKRGLSDFGTDLCGVVFVMALLRFVGKVRSKQLG